MAIRKKRPYCVRASQAEETRETTPSQREALAILFRLALWTRAAFSRSAPNLNGTLTAS
jgi:hypothetical protein